MPVSPDNLIERNSSIPYGLNPRTGRLEAPINDEQTVPVLIDEWMEPGWKEIQSIGWVLVVPPAIE